MVQQRFVRLIAAVCLLNLATESIVFAQNDGEGNRGGQREGGDREGGGREGRGGRGRREGGRGGFFGPGGGPGPGGMMQIGKAMLLGLPTVRDELKLEDAQQTSIEAALESFREERRSARPDRSAIENMSEEERDALREKMRTDSEALNQKTDAILEALLEPSQAERLDQIALQMRLNMQITTALKSDDLREKLGITDDQISQLTKLEEDMQARREEARDAIADGDRDSMREMFTKMREEAQKNAIAVLTDEQKTKLEALKGAAFEVDMMAMMGGRGRGGRGPGGEGDGGGRREGGRREGGRREGGRRERQGNPPADGE